ATVYTFKQPTGVAGAYAITSLADAAGRTETFTYAGGRLSAASAASGRALHYTWSTPAGASAPHVATVATDPATAGDASTVSTWTYSYSGDQLTKVCPPTSATACTTYAYTAASQHPTAVLDAGPRSYWRLGESSGETRAASSVLANEGVVTGPY